LLRHTRSTGNRTSNSTYVAGDYNKAKILDAIYVGRNNVVSGRAGV
jgi:hypothetical protein